MDERQLIERFIRHRDERAFHDLYAAHSPAVYGLIRRLAGAADLAEDVLQETWMRAAVSLPLFRGDSAFRTWLTGIALNCYRERRRALPPFAADSRPEVAVESNTQTFDIDAVLDGLSPIHREVLVLHDVEGYTHDEIANALGIEAGTSKSRLSRARALFRERWRPRPAEGDHL